MVEEGPSAKPYFCNFYVRHLRHVNHKLTVSVKNSQKHN